MKIYRIIELTDGKLTKLHNTFQLSMGRLNEALDKVVNEYLEKGMTRSACHHRPYWKKIWMDGEGFVEIRIIERLYSMDRFSGKMSRLVIGVIEYEAR
jgi:hypothetical protein